MEEITEIIISTEVQGLLTIDQAWHYKVLPKEIQGNLIKLYYSEDSKNTSIKEELELLLGYQVDLIAVANQTIIEGLNRYYLRQRNGNQVNSKYEFDGEDFVFQLIKEANQSGSSDIHIETYEDACRIRIRINGRLVEKYRLKLEDYPALINKLKIKANLDIAEKRLPQDGRITFESQNSKFDIRISILPTLYGEKVVMRLLSKDATEIEIEKLGFNERQLRVYLDGVKQSHGIVLISGPTGSGKTTTLYATLKNINDDKTNILTIEDPVEYTLPGINQVQLNEAIGLTFSSALRSFLRQDPDVIMLGEIRDEDTAKMAIRAALTGHLVLSTIHTNSAWGTISRLIDMGIPSYLLANTINVTAAQRLVRILCSSCKEKRQVQEGDLPHAFIPPYPISEVYEAGKCEQCNYTGYTGRKALYEVIPIKGEFLQAIRNEESNIQDLLNENQINTLLQEAFDLLANGKTSLEEVYSLLMTNH